MAPDAPADKAAELTVLVVEDEPRISASIAEALRAAHYHVLTSPSGEDAFFLLHAHNPHLMVLDLGLPGRSGMELLLQIRAMRLSLPILILTSNSSMDDRILALDSGADDFLLKPFSIVELQARIRALARRLQPASIAAPRSHLLEDAELDLEINLDTRVAHRAGRLLELTQREFDLLVYLLQHRGRAVSREALTRDVWHETSRYTPLDNVINVQITRLRRKLDDPFSTKILRTIRGVGFLLGVSENQFEDPGEPLS